MMTHTHTQTHTHTLIHTYTHTYSHSLFMLAVIWCRHEIHFNAHFTPLTSCCCSLHTHTLVTRPTTRTHTHTSDTRHHRHTHLLVLFVLRMNREHLVMAEISRQQSDKDTQKRERISA